MGLYEKLISKETWKKVHFFMSFHDFSEGRTPVTKKDIVPLVLTFMLALVAFLVAICLYWALSEFMPQPYAVVLVIIVMTAAFWKVRRLFGEP
jgi:uncharacterized membrane protein YoaK (UPF0700 family)